MYRFLLLLQALLLLPAAERATAATLGEEFILSRLGDPVEVEIDVLQWEDIDLELLQISAAGQREYETFNLSWHPAIEQLNFNLLGPDLDGTVKVLVSSREPFEEPFLELLLVLRWPGGSLLREYVLLFDPPGTPAPITQSAATAVVPDVDEPALPAVPDAEPQQPAQEIIPEIPEAIVEAEPEPEPEPEQPAVEIALQETEIVADAEPEATLAPVEPEAPVATTPEEVRTTTAIEVESVAVTIPEPAPIPAERPTVERREYQVRPGDNLWDIARQFRPAGAGENLYQMLLSIHDLNRRAFINGNISLLRANASLALPSAEDITQINPVTARAVFEQRWEEGTRRFEAAQRGEALPIFGGPGSVVEEPVVEEPELPLGQEAPVTQGADVLIQVDGTNALQPLPDEEDLQVQQSASDIQAQNAVVPSVAFPEAPPVVVVVERSDPQPDGTAGEPTTSPALERINAAATGVQDLLASRQERIQQVRQQILLVRERLEQARTLTADLDPVTGSSAGILQSGSVLLLVTIAVLSLALLLALVLVLREASQLQRGRL